MGRISEFNEKDWKEIHEFLNKWNESKYGGKSDLPDHCSQKAACYNIPMAIAALKTGEETRKLNSKVFWLTLIIASLTLVLVAKDLTPVLMSWSIGKQLKLSGFFINIIASLYLISRALSGERKPSLWDCLTGKAPWNDLFESRIYDLAYLNRDALITSALVIIGSTLQFTSDLFDP